MVPKAKVPCENSISPESFTSRSKIIRTERTIMELDLERVQRNVRKATTEDLLDRATVYRSEMEPAALPIIEKELADRGITVEEVEAHLQARNNALITEKGTALKCSFCWKPAVESGWDWHRMYGKIPVFPRRLRWCVDHLPASRRKSNPAADPVGESE
jgi:hypothetical protein